MRQNIVSFPSQIPVFSKKQEPDLQWRAVLLYFVCGWSTNEIAERFDVPPHRILEVLDDWARRAVALGYIQVIDLDRFHAQMPEEVLASPRSADANPGAAGMYEPEEDLAYAAPS